MDASDDEAARKTRADRLHAEIEHLQYGGAASDAAATPEEVSSESPREFIERRMGELAEEGASSGTLEPLDAVP